MALQRSAPGVRMGDIRALQDAAAGLQGADASGALTATAGGNQANGVQLTQGVNEITVCATNADSAQLPPADAGARVYVGNSGAADAKIFGKNGRTDTINGTAGATGVTLATTKNAVLFCAVAGKWRMVLTA
jgi:hypothetical protein